jgi:hypothetical protein
LKSSFKAPTGCDRFHSYMQLKLQTYVWERCHILKCLVFYNCDDWRVHKIKPWKCECVLIFL